MSARVWVVAGAAVAVAVAAVATVPRNPAEPRVETVRAEVVTPSNATLVCPESPTGRATTSEVFAVSTGERSRASVVRVEALDPKREQPVETLRRPGTPSVQRLTPGRLAPAARISARGSLAAVLTATQWFGYDGRDQSGLAVSGCGRPEATWWFNGVDTSVGATSRLVLSNPTPAVAVVDLTIYGPGGVVDAVGARGIAVAPNGRQELDLARLAPGRDALSIQAATTRGRVVAAIHTRRVEGLTPAGAEWLAPAAPPARQVLVNPGLAGDGDQELLLTNPGSREALVQVEVYDEDGAYEPAGLADVRVPPGSVVTEDLSKVTKRKAAAVRLTSTAPVSAAIDSEASDGPRDFAVTSTAPSLTGATAVPVVDGGPLSMAFTSAAPAGGTVTIETRTADGATLATEDVRVEGRRTTVWELPRSRGRGEQPAYVVVTPEPDRDLQGAVLYEGRRGSASIPLLSSETSVRVPAVKPSP